MAGAWLYEFRLVVRQSGLVGAGIATLDRSAACGDVVSGGQARENERQGEIAGPRDRRQQKQCRVAGSSQQQDVTGRQRRRLQGCPRDQSGRNKEARRDDGDAKCAEIGQWPS